MKSKPKETVPRKDNATQLYTPAQQKKTETLPWPSPKRQAPSVNKALLFRTAGELIELICRPNCSSSCEKNKPPSLAKDPRWRQPKP